MGKKTSSEILEGIIKAKNKDEAKEIIYDTLRALHIATDYKELKGYKDQLDDFQAEFSDISSDYAELAVPSLEDLQSLRNRLNFLYRDLADSLSFEVNRLKIHYEEYKTVQRYKSMKDVQSNESIEFKVGSASAARELIGADEGYQRYITLASFSYGLWQDFRDLQNAIKMMTDNIAARYKTERDVQIKDVK